MHIQHDLIFLWNLDSEENGYKEVTRFWKVLLLNNILCELDDESNKCYREHYTVNDEDETESV